MTSRESICRHVLEPIYLDGLSTTQLAPEAREAMLAAWTRPGNPGSPHKGGEEASAAVERGRASVARLIGASPGEIVLTSGATEANNLAVTGIALAALSGASRRRRIVVSALEHKAVLVPALRLREAGFTVDVIPATSDGIIDLEALASLIDEDVLLVSLMAANNETGVVQPVAKAAGLAHAQGALLHCDAAQAVGKIAIDVIDLDVDYLSASSHKMYGPVGVGALYVSAGVVPPTPLATGGGQERGLRAGTEPAPLIAGFGAAAEAAFARMEDDGCRANALLGKLLERIKLAGLPIRVNGNGQPRLPGAASIVVEGTDAQSLVQSLSKRVMLSTGSACTAGQITTSHVLDAMHISASDKRSTLRLIFGRFNHSVDADGAAEALIERVTSGG